METHGSNLTEQPFSTRHDNNLSISLVPVLQTCHSRNKTCKIKLKVFKWINKRQRKLKQNKRIKCCPSTEKVHSSGMLCNENNLHTTLIIKIMICSQPSNSHMSNTTSWKIARNILTRYPHNNANRWNLTLKYKQKVQVLTAHLLHATFDTTGHSCIWLWSWN